MRLTRFLAADELAIALALALVLIAAAPPLARWVLA